MWAAEGCTRLVAGVGAAVPAAPDNATGIITEQRVAGTHGQAMSSDCDAPVQDVRVDNDLKLDKPGQQFNYSN
jgi:hypothetical protein